MYALWIVNKVYTSLYLLPHFTDIGMNEVAKNSSLKVFKRETELPARPEKDVSVTKIAIQWNLVKLRSRRMSLVDI
jgi:hypothetical protein